MGTSGRGLCLLLWYGSFGPAQARPGQDFHEPRGLQNDQWKKTRLRDPRTTKLSRGPFRIVVAPSHSALCCPCATATATTAMTVRSMCIPARPTDDRATIGVLELEGQLYFHSSQIKHRAHSEDIDGNAKLHRTLPIVDARDALLHRLSPARGPRPPPVGGAPRGLRRMLRHRASHVRRHPRL